MFTENNEITKYKIKKNAFLLFMYIIHLSISTEFGVFLNKIYVYYIDIIP